MKESYYLDELVNSGLSMQIDGRELRFSELRVKDFGRMQEHLRRIQPKPSDVVGAALRESGATKDEIAKGMLLAYEQDLFWPASIDSRLGLSLVERDESARVALVRYTLEKHHPSLSESEAVAIAESLSIRQWSVIAVFATSGRRPEDLPEDPDEESGEGESTPAPEPTGTS